jgi:hypothetical protein
MKTYAVAKEAETKKEEKWREKGIPYRSKSESVRDAKSRRTHLVPAVDLSTLIQVELYGNNLCYSHDINFNFLHFRVIPAPF